jgi:hypothetical protein
LGLLRALKGVGNRAFYRWLTRDYRPLFPRLLERTRLFRLFKTHQDWIQVFLASPTVVGVIDTYGIELIHPIARRPESPVDRPQRPLQSPLDCWWPTVSPAQSVGGDRRMGVPPTGPHARPPVTCRAGGAGPLIRKSRFVAQLSSSKG